MTRRYLSPVLLLLLAGLLTLLLQNPVRRFVVMPLLAVYWVARLALAAVPQVVFWWLFLAAGLLAALAVLLKTRPAARPVPAPKEPAPGRIESWLTLLEKANLEPYYRWQLAQHLQTLTLDILAYRERLSPAEIKQRLGQNTLPLPPDVQAYLQASMTSFSHLLGSRSLFRPNASPAPLNLEPERIITFLEERLEHYPD